MKVSSASSNLVPRPNKMSKCKECGAFVEDNNICEVCYLLHEFSNPNGCIDDPEELLDQLPFWLTELRAYRKQAHNK